MNTQRKTLHSLHVKYIECITKKVDEFVKEEGSADSTQKEFCGNEKQTYFNYMRDNFKTEFENLIRMEGNNY